MAIVKYRPSSKYYLIFEDVKEGFTKNKEFIQIAYTDGNVYRIISNVDNTYYGWGCQGYGPTDRYSWVRKITKEEIQSTGIRKIICIFKSLFTIKKAYNLDSTYFAIPVKNINNMGLYKKGVVTLYEHGCTQNFNF